MKKKRIIPLLCALLVVLTLPLMQLAAQAASDSIYFSCVNETVMELNDATMPFFANGVLYVPYTMFDPELSGSNLGLFSSYSRSKGVVLIYGWSGSLLFDLQKGTATFGGKEFPSTAIVRNSVAFVPLNTVCQNLGLDWSWLMVSHGYVIRVKNSSSVLNDREFATAAAYTLNERYNSYMQSKTPAPSPSVSPKPTTSVKPDPSPSPSVSPLEGAQLRFAISMTEDSAGFDTLLSHLAKDKVFALFLCHPDDLLARDDDVRTLLSAGHKIGLLLDGDTPEARLEQLEQGRQLLSRIAHVPVTMVCSTAPGETEAVDPEEHVLLWRSTIDTTAEALSTAQQITLITRSAADGSPQFILLDDSAAAATALNGILSALGAKGCEFPPVTEVSLSTLN